MSSRGSGASPGEEMRTGTSRRWQAGGGAGARAAATQLLGEDDEQGEALVGWACRGDR